MKFKVGDILESIDIKEYYELVMIEGIVTSRSFQQVHLKIIESYSNPGDVGEIIIYPDFVVDKLLRIKPLTRYKIT